jgi:serine/threonine-protein kinase
MIGKIATFTGCLAGLCAALVTTLGARGARAEVSPDSSAAAQALFDEAKRLIQQGDARAACPKFEESQRLEPGVGTKLNLANCYEQIGRTASAWILFLEVESDTKRNGQIERQSMAHNRAAALLPKLSQLKIDVPQASRAAGLMVQRDGVPVGDPQWGLPIPVDPGEHTVQVGAPGKKPWQARITVAAEANLQSVSVPLLENAPAEQKPALVVSAGPHSRAQRTAAYVSFGVSGASAIVGSVFGLRAISKNNQSDAPEQCNPNNDCVASGATLRNQARSAGDVATVLFAVSGVALATGFVLLLTEKKQEAPAATQITAGAFVTPSSAALSLRGAW